MRGFQWLKARHGCCPVTSADHAAAFAAPAGSARRPFSLLALWLELPRPLPPRRRISRPTSAYPNLSLLESSPRVFSRSYIALCCSSQSPQNTSQRLCSSYSACPRVFVRAMANPACHETGPTLLPGDCRSKFCAKKMMEGK